MAQTGYTPIQLYYSSTTTNAPLAANLAYGELAINITDGKLFYKDNANAIQVIGWKVVPATAGGTGQTSYAVGDLLYADTTTSLAKLPDVATGNALISGGVSTAPSWGKIGLTTHVSGTLPTANGGTNLTSFTANGVMYASSSSALATGSALTFDGTNFSCTGSITSTKAYANTSDLGLVASANIPGWNLRASGGGRLSMVTGYIGNDISSLLAGTGTNNPTTEVMRVTHSSGDVNFITGNVVIGTSGKGIDFSATSGSGTSELLADYEEGTWTPIDGSGAGLTFTVLANSAKYTKIGRMVTATFALSYPVTAAAGQAAIGGLPFTSGTGAGQGGYLVYTSLASIPGLNVSPSSTIFYLYGGSGTGLSNVNMSTQDIRGVVIYFV